MPPGLEFGSVRNRTTLAMSDLGPCKLDPVSPIPAFVFSHRERSPPFPFLRGSSLLVASHFSIRASSSRGVRLRTRLIDSLAGPTLSQRRGVSIAIQQRNRRNTRAPMAGQDSLCGRPKTAGVQFPVLTHRDSNAVWRGNQVSTWRSTLPGSSFYNAPFASYPQSGRYRAGQSSIQMRKLSSDRSLPSATCRVKNRGDEG